MIQINPNGEQTFVGLSNDVIEHFVEVDGLLKNGYFVFGDRGEAKHF